MRRVWRWLVCLAVIGLFGSLVVPVRTWLDQLALRREAPDDYADHQVGIGYVLEREGWTEFALTPGLARLRFLVNGGWVGGEPVPEVDFAVAYSFLNENGDLLAGDQYHFRAGQGLFETPTGPRPAVVFEDKTVTALDPRLATVVPPPGTTRVRFQVIEGDVGLGDVVVRLYAPNTLTPGTENVAWLRLRQIEKQRLARATLEDYRFLPDREIASLVHHVWRPVGPIGIKDRDYFVRRVFTRRENPGRQFDIKPPLLELPVTAPGRIVTVPLPEQPGCFTVVLSPQSGVEADTPLRRPPQVRWTLHRRDQVPASEIGALHSDRETVWQVDLTAEHRFLEIAADDVRVVKTYFTAPPAEPDLAVLPSETGGNGSLSPYGAPLETPLPRVETWRLGPDQPLRFTFYGAPGQPTPLRFRFYTLPLDFESVGESGQVLPAQSRVTWTARAGDGSVLSEQTLDWVPEPDAYDYLDPFVIQTPIATMLERVWYGPRATRTLEIRAEQDGLVQVALRPEDLPLVRKVPDDYREVGQSEAALPLWFPMAPDAAWRLRTEGRRLWVVHPLRPPELDPERIAGQAWVEAPPLLPVGPGRNLLLPRRRDSFFDKRSLAGCFLAITPNRDLELDLRHHLAGKVTPSLLFLRPEGTGLIRIQREGTVLREVTTSAVTGAVPLGPLPQGKQRFKFTAEPGARLYLNYLEPNDEFLRQVMVRRFDQPLSLDIVKHARAPVTVAVRLFAPIGAETATVVTTRLSLPPRAGFSETITPRLARFEVAPAALPIISAGPPDLDEGTVFFVPLADDLPAGTYRLTLEKQSGPAHFIRATLGRPLAVKPTEVKPTSDY